MSKRIENILYKALLLSGKMEQALYEYELKEHLDYWEKDLIKDKDEFVFVVTEKKGDVAMVLLTKKGELFINEKARQQLHLCWKGVYETNIEFLLPTMAKQLSKGILSVNGVKYATKQQLAIHSEMNDILQLKITLKHTTPPIWRRILIEKKRTFFELHHIIQVTMGWHNSHLFQFNINGHKITEPDEDLDLELGEKSIDASEARLRDFIKQVGEKFEYEYDFGDGWMHQIVVEKFLPREKKTKYPVCLDGKMNCPPEDCGGIGGFYGMLEIIGSKGHPERKEMLQWLGGKYHPEHFDKDIVNIELAAIDE